VSVTSPPSDSKTLERVMERSYYKDWKRLGFGIHGKTANSSGGSSSILNKVESFRISFVNTGYSVCRTYPALLVVPTLVSDESVKKVSRCYRGGRLPVITWRHAHTRAFLVRAASFSSKRLMAFLKTANHSSSGTAHHHHHHLYICISPSVCATGN